jgi:hypothetical protein
LAGRRRGAQTMYTHVGKCKIDKIKKDILLLVILVKNWLIGEILCFIRIIAYFI